MKFVNEDLMLHNYSSYDVVYTYQPIIGSEPMIEALKAILKTMKKGAILIFLMAGTDPNELVKIPNFVGRVADLHVFKK